MKIHSLVLAATLCIGASAQADGNSITMQIAANSTPAHYDLMVLQQAKNPACSTQAIENGENNPNKDLFNSQKDLTSTSGAITLTSQLSDGSNPKCQFTDSSVSLFYSQAGTQEVNILQAAFGDDDASAIEIHQVTKIDCRESDGAGWDCSYTLKGSATPVSSLVAEFKVDPSLLSTPINVTVTFDPAITLSSLQE